MMIAEDLSTTATRLAVSTLRAMMVMDWVRRQNTPEQHTHQCLAQCSSWDTNRSKQSSAYPSDWESSIQHQQWRWWGRSWWRRRSLCWRWGWPREASSDTWRWSPRCCWEPCWRTPELLRPGNCDGILPALSDPNSGDIKLLNILVFQQNYIQVVTFFKFDIIIIMN